MKRRFAWSVLVALVLGLCVPPVFAQASGTVKGVCRDQEGKPIAEGTVEWLNSETGRKYTLKLNKKGEYFSLGVAPGKYKVTLFGADGKQIFYMSGIQVGLDELTQDIDLKKEAAAQAAGQGLTPEQVKAQQEAQAKAQQENMTIKQLNEKLLAAKTASDAGDFDGAIKVLSEGTQIDPNRDLLWFKLADAYRLFAHGHVAEPIVRRELERLIGAAVQVPDDIESQVREYLAQHPADHWDEAVRQIAARNRKQQRGEP